MPTTLSQRLRAARKAMHPTVTQREVAKKLKLSPSAVCLWESGGTEPSARDIATLAQWYGVSADWLIGLEERQPRHPRAKPPLWTVPVLQPSQLAKWKLDVAVELLQTTVSYPIGTAAAMLVASDALRSTCPTGCYAVVSKAHLPAPGHVVLATVSRTGDPVVRKYVREGSDHLLLADDTRYPSYRMHDGAKIIGRVTEVTVRTVLL